MSEVSKFFGIDKNDLKHIYNIGSKEEEEIRDLYNEALDYFGTRKSAYSWLRTENRGLGSVTPLALLKGDNGIVRIRTSINKLRHGMTA
jgi:uncharacterized protein (DUF2384 family)